MFTHPRFFFKTRAIVFFYNLYRRRYPNERWFQLGYVRRNHIVRSSTHPRWTIDCFSQLKHSFANKITTGYILDQCCHPRAYGAPLKSSLDEVPVSQKLVVWGHAGKMVSNFASSWLGRGFDRNCSECFCFKETLTETKVKYAALWDQYN